MTEASSAERVDASGWVVPAVRWVVVVSLLGSVVFYAWASRHWMILSDSAVMHYVRLLLDHGLKPYSEISDNNMPGAYLTEGWGMRVFGYSDAGWRVYDFCLAAILLGAMVVIAKPYDCVAGVFGAGMFTVMHGAEGPMYSV